MPDKTLNYDVVVVGGGNTALCAALTAHEHGARVAMLEAAPRAERGGNSRFSGTAWRFVHNGKEHLLPLLDPGGLKEAGQCSMSPYTAEDFTRDMLEKSGGRHDRDEIRTIIEYGYDTMKWLADHGVPFKLPLNFWVSHQGKDGIQELAPGVPVVTRDYGRGLTDAMWASAETASIDVFYSMPAHDLITDGDQILGIQARGPKEYHEFYGQVILACGGFEANPRMRRQYLGPGTELAIVRGTRFNTGTMLEKAIAAGAQAQGHWGGYHCAPQDAAAPPIGDMETLDAWERYSFPYSIMVNKSGRRFTDEGENEISLIYSKVGAAIAQEQDARAFQVFDSKVAHLISEKYKTHSTPIQADTLEGLAEKMGVPVSSFLDTVSSFNSATESNTLSSFDAYSNDGLCTKSGFSIRKSNWALPIDKPPYTSYAVTLGITFTFGGISTNRSGQVLNNEGNVMSGLYAMGEMTGGFYYGYAAGASLIRSSVMARIAGKHAAEEAKTTRTGVRDLRRDTKL
jgi:tricarballylate dehydrogenase